MATTAERLETWPTAGFRHEALLYAGDDGFVDGTLPWLREAVAAQEPALVVVSAARIAPAWREFVDAHADSGRRLRGIGEPIWADRTPDELVECQRHEALLNVA